MKIIFRTYYVMISLLLFSCNKVIEIKLRDTETKYVIEGVITNEPGICKVVVTQTRNFNEDNRFQTISGATVTVADNGVKLNLAEVQPGVYETRLLNGTPGHTYQLQVIIDNNSFTATSIMPEPVLMDTLYVSRGPFGQFKFATVGYKDPAGINNGYRFVQYVNGIKEPTIFWENDEFVDGEPVIMQLDASADEKDDPRNIKSGDEVTVEMQCLDDIVYKYWYTLRAGGGAGDGTTAAPANPITNIHGGAIGYFSAHTVNRRMVIAP